MQLKDYLRTIDHFKIMDDVQSHLAEVSLIKFYDQIVRREILLYEEMSKAEIFG